MTSAYDTMTQRRQTVLEEFKRTYTPFFNYEAELKKGIFRILFTINGQERTVRSDPQFIETELQDVIAAVEAAKDAIVSRVRSDAIKEAKEKLKQRIEAKTYMGHGIKWTYAYELMDMEGFMCQEDKLFLPVEYDDIYGENTYNIKIHDDWEDRAVKYFEDNFGSQTFIKRLKCPDSLKDYVVEFAAAQKMFFTKQDRYVCQVQEEYIPGKDTQPRWHFEFGDFIEKDGSWEYVKDSGIYSIYDNDKEHYMYLYNSLCEAIPDKDINPVYVDGEGLYYGKTRFRLYAGSWFKEIELTPDMNNWEGSVVKKIKKECDSCMNIVWSKVNKCLDNILNRDIAELLIQNGDLSPDIIMMNLAGQKELYPPISHSGIYKGYKKEEFESAINALISAKIIKLTKVNKTKGPSNVLSITDWGKEMFKRHKKSLNDVELRARKAVDAYDAGKEPGDENAAALLKTIKTRKKSGEKDKEYLEKIAKNKNITLIYGDILTKLMK